MVLRPNAIVLVLYGFTRGEKQRTLSIQLSLHGMDTQDTLLNTQVSGPEESQKVHCQ